MNRITTEKAQKATKNLVVWQIYCNFAAAFRARHAWTSVN